MTEPGPSSASPADITIGYAAMIESLQEEMRNMRSVMELQQDEITKLRNEAEKSRSQPPNASVVQPVVQQRSVAAPRIPQIDSFSGSRDEQNSTKVKAFIYDMKKLGQLGKMDETGMLDLADCYLRDRAATWMMNMEMKDTKPDTIDKLQDAMIREFVPPDEKARAKTKLMKHKLNKSLDWYVSTFRDFVDICHTLMSEAYLFFFNGLPDEYKEEFTKFYPTGEPESMQEVYEHARTLERAMQWNNRSTKRGGERSNNRGDKDRSPPKQRDKPTEFSKGTRQKPRDKDALIWGPAGEGERQMYRKNARCYDCGAKYTPAHVCEDKKGNGKGTDRPAGNSPNA